MLNSQWVKKKIFEFLRTIFVNVKINHFLILAGPYKWNLISEEKPALIFLVFMKFVNRLL